MKSELTGQDYPSKESMLLKEKIEMEKMAALGEMPWEVAYPLPLDREPARLVPESQARALWEVARMIIEMSDKATSWKLDDSPYPDFWKAIALLRKGISK